MAADLSFFILTPCSRALLEELTGLQLVTKLLPFNGTQKFITQFTTPQPRVTVIRQTKSGHAPSYLFTPHLFESYKI